MIIESFQRWNYKDKVNSERATNHRHNVVDCKAFEKRGINELMPQSYTEKFPS